MSEIREFLKSFAAPPLAGSQPGFGLRGWIGEDAYQAAIADLDDDFPVGWDERDAKV